MMTSCIIMRFLDELKDSEGLRQNFPFQNGPDELCDLSIEGRAKGSWAVPFPIFLGNHFHANNSTFLCFQWPLDLLVESMWMKSDALAQLGMLGVGFKIKTSR